MNPLFAADDDDNNKKQGTGYVLPNRHGRKIAPLHDNIRPETVHPAHPVHHTRSHHLNPGPQTSAAVIQDDKGADPAVDLIRRKLETLYAQEPNAAGEMVAVEAQRTLISPSNRSKHQQFMHDLSTSGKSLAEIQTAWHEYYAKLPDSEKHAVWQEFYSSNNRQDSGYSQFAAAQPAAVVVSETPDHYNRAGSVPQAPIPVFPGLSRKNRKTMVAQPGVSEENRTPVVAGYERPEHKKPGKKKPDSRTAQAIKKQIKKRVNLSSAQQAKAMQHAKSLLFGVGSGAIVLVIVLFGLFNEVVLAPFIQPSRQASATPIILNTDSVAPSSTPEVIIPKTSVQIPVDYTLDTSDEATFQKALESAVVHYHTTSKPGEKGNTAIFGHSSNNIFNPGKYKFAFVKLHELVPGDIFYLTNNQKVYSYRVYDKRIVPPSDTSVLDPVPDKTATATLITCDPPGTSLNRLVVWGEQISPDPNGNVDATAPSNTETTQPTQITGNGPTLWQRLTGWLQ
jgi:LPXTG-site transpeptidase (sortase) family protein